jgi:NADPH2:quinone reductase
MTEAIVLRNYGGPEVLKIESTTVGPPQAGEVRIRHTAIGVNYHDVYVRSGAYRTLELPGIPGTEAVGVVEALGHGVSNLKVGQRVAYMTPKYGTYSTARNLPAHRAVALPDSLDDESAASIFVKGMTACMLLRKVYAVQPGDTILVHAAAGGVGQALVGWAKYIGARVIATVGSEAKAEIARKCGADEVIFYRTEDVAARVADITKGKGVAAAYDAVGKDTFDASLASLALFGKLVFYGQASGPVDPLPPSALAAKSNTLTFPVIFHYVEEYEAMRSMATELFSAIAAQAVSPSTSLLLSLAEAPEAHRALEARETSGSIILLP